MTSPPITGSLTVDLTDDPKDTNASIKVAMWYTGTDIRYKTSVCLMNVPGADGLFIYVSGFSLASTILVFTQPSGPTKR